MGSRAAWFLLLLLWSAGCAPDVGECSQNALHVTPGEVSLVYDANTTSEDVRLPLKASTSREGDVTAQATFAIDDRELGSIEQGALVVRNSLRRGGLAKVIVNYKGLTGTATLSIRYIAKDVVDPSIQGDPASYFTGPSTGASPRWVYPFSGTMIPRNLTEIDLQVAGPVGGVYRLRLEGPTYQQNVYLGDGKCPSGECTFRPDPAQWLAIARSVAGTEVTVRAARSPGPGQPYGTSDLKMQFSPEDVQGGLYYWSTSIQGIYRVRVDAREPKIFVQNGNEYGCAGCHSVSRDGRKVAMQFGGVEDGLGGVVSGASGTTYLIKPPASGPWRFQTFSPDGSLLLVNWETGGRVIKTATGEKVQDLPADLVGRMAQPDWSPDGESIVYVRYPQEGEGQEHNAVNAGDIVILPWNGGKLGAPRTIVSSTRDKEYHFYPSFSPDSKWIIFNTGTVPCRTTDFLDSPLGRSYFCSVYDAQNTRLRLVQVAPGKKPVDLNLARHEERGSTNWPRVAPLAQAGGKLIFFTYSARYPFGFQKKNDNPQIWMAAVDLEKAERFPTKDPSYPPFWMPFQRITENNHLGTWATQVACNVTSDCPNGFECRSGACAVSVQ